MATPPAKLENAPKALGELRVSELKERLHELGEPTTGLKQDLVTRLSTAERVKKESGPLTAGGRRYAAVGRTFGKRPARSASPKLRAFGRSRTPDHIFDEEAEQVAERLAKQVEGRAGRKVGRRVASQVKQLLSKEESEADSDGTTESLEQEAAPEERQQRERRQRDQAEQRTPAAKRKLATSSSALVAKSKSQRAPPGRRALMAPWVSVDQDSGVVQARYDTATATIEGHVTQLRKGRSGVDQRCPVAGETHVLDDGGCVYDALLNQADIAHNHNKYYLLQVLQRDPEQGKGTAQAKAEGKLKAESASGRGGVSCATSGSSGGQPAPLDCYVWTRWGRVGEARSRQNALRGPMEHELAVAEFEKKFKDKTRNQWAERDRFVSHEGKYTLLARGKVQPPVVEGEAKAGEPPQGQLALSPSASAPEPTGAMIASTSDPHAIETSMRQIGFDADALPLGPLQDETLTHAQQVLDELAAHLGTSHVKLLRPKRQDTATPSAPLGGGGGGDGGDGGRSAEMLRLSNSFYSLVPHISGRAPLPLIDTPALLREKYELLDTLRASRVEVEALPEEDVYEALETMRRLLLRCASGSLVYLVCGVDKEQQRITMQVALQLRRPQRAAQQPVRLITK